MKWLKDRKILASIEISKILIAYYTKYDIILMPLDGDSS